MNLHALKAQIIEFGWKIIPSSRFDPLHGVDWAAVKPTKGLPECHCNDRSPQLYLTPWSIESDGRTMESATVSITAETKDGTWLELKAYGLKPQVDEIEAACPKVVVAWIAASETH